MTANLADMAVTVALCVAVIVVALSVIFVGPAV